MRETSQDKLFLHYTGLNDIVFAIFLPSNPGSLVPCTLDNVCTTLSYQTSNMILINATSLLVHFFVMSKFYVFVLCLRVFIVRSGFFRR